MFNTLSLLIITILTWLISKNIEERQKTFQSSLKTEILHNQIFSDFLWSQASHPRFRDFLGDLTRVVGDESNHDSVISSHNWMLINEFRHSNYMDFPRVDVLQFLKQVRLLETEAIKILSADDSDGNRHPAGLLKYLLSGSSFIDYFRFTKNDLTVFISSWSPENRVNRILKKEYRYPGWWMSIFNFFYEPIDALISVLKQGGLQMRENLFGNPEEINSELAQTLSDIIISKAESKKIITLDNQPSLLADSYLLRIE